ncbi:WG repeat-containing protein [Lewinella sp. LCG006]|uniref:WG repeat-containing protein n=1 Tax=Lewinella sp. LCG006 TaxID=3231911 RepID=UPI00345F3789
MRPSYIFLLFFAALCANRLFAQEAPMVYPFAYQNQWGIVQEDRVVVMTPQLDSIGFFFNPEPSKRYALALDDQKYGLLNADGSWLAKPKLDSIGDIEYYATSTHWAVSKGKFGLLSTKAKKAKWLVKPTFTTVTEFEGRKVALASVAIDGRWGVINGDGILIAPCIYEEVKLLDDYSGYPDYKLTLNGEHSYIDAFGVALSPERIKEIEDDLEMWGDDIVFEDQSIDESTSRPRFQINQQKNPNGGTDIILTKNGSETERVNVPDGYSIQETKLNENYGNAALGYILVKKENKYGFWASNGTLASPPIYDQINWVSSNRYGQLAYLHKGEKVGLANYRGDQIFPAAFTSITEFNHRFRLVHPDGYLGYGDENGKIFLPQNVDITE